MTGVAKPIAGPGRPPTVGAPPRHRQDTAAGCDKRTSAALGDACVVDRHAWDRRGLLEADDRITGAG